MEPEERVLDLLKNLVGERGFTQATSIDIERVERCSGLSLPPELKRWLALCNGCLAGDAILLGSRADYPILDICAGYDRETVWRDKSWIPVANDGCGNYFVLDASGSGGRRHIYFVDRHVAGDELAYAVASNLWNFLIFLLEDASCPFTVERLWPFDKDHVLKQDPALANYEGPAPPKWRERETEIPDDFFDLE